MSALGAIKSWAINHQVQWSSAVMSSSVKVQVVDPSRCQCPRSRDLSDHVCVRPHDWTRRHSTCCLAMVCKQKRTKKLSRATGAAQATGHCGPSSHASTLQHWLGIGGVQVNRRPRDKSMSKVKRMGSGRWCLDDRPLFNSLDAGFGNEIQQETIKGTESNKWLSMLGQIEDQQHKLT